MPNQQRCADERARRTAASNRLSLFATAAAMIGLLAPAAAFAQTSAAPAAPAGLEEVVVTAQRYRSNVQTTPVAVTALTTQALADRHVVNVLDAATQIPGIVMTPATGTSSGARIVLRGAGQENTGILFDPAVGIYVDNVYQPRLNGGFFDFFDIDRLEVLRGPQGTLYGRNTSGGAVKIVTLRPSSVLTYSGDVALGSYGQQDVRAYVSGPLIGDTLLGSISAVSRKRDGWTVDTNYGRKVNNKDIAAVRAKLLYKPTDKINIELAYDVQTDRSDPGIGSQVTLLPGTVNPAARPGRDLFTSELAGPAYAKVDSNGGSINATYDLTDSLQLSSITGYRSMDVTQAAPFTLQTNGTYSGTSYVFKDDVFSQEVNASLTAGRLKGVVGLYYFREKGFEVDAAPYVAAANTRDRVTTAEAAFAQGSYELVGGLSLTAGLRYTQEKAEFTQFYYTQRNFAQSASKTFTATTPKVGLDWQINPDVLAYVSYTKGFKSGGFNAVAPNTNTGVPGSDGRPTPYDAERVESYEGGVKFRTPDRRLRVNVAIYQAEYDGFQLPVFFPGTFNSYTSNAAGARVRGIEIEPTWQVTSSLQLYGNMSFSDGKYTSPFTCLLPNVTFAECSGKKIKGVVPAKTLVGVTYSPELSIPGKLHFNLDWQHSEKYYNTVANLVDLVQTPRYDLVNGSIAWDSPDDHWTVALEGRNLTDEMFAIVGIQSANAVSPAVTSYPNDPRTFDIRVRAKF